MEEIIGGSPYAFILENLLKKIDESKLPLYGEAEYKKITADRYGKVKIKLDILKNQEIIREIESYQSETSKKYFTYKWEVANSNFPKEFEIYIRPTIVEFIELFSMFQTYDDNFYSFSVVDGEFKQSERPGHSMATKLAIMDLFKKI